MSNSYAPKEKPTTSTGREPPAVAGVITLSVTSETWRFRAYLGFWFFCSFAIAISRIFVVPFLAKGPADGSSCGPFNRVSTCTSIILSIESYNANVIRDTPRIILSIESYNANVIRDTPRKI